MVAGKQNFNGWTAELLRLSGLERMCLVGLIPGHTELEYPRFKTDKATTLSF